MISRPLVAYVLTAAARDRVVWAFLLIAAAGAAVAIFLGSATVVERREFALVFASGGFRFLGVLTAILFPAFYIRRAFENREVEFLLSRPVTRSTFVVSHLAAFIILAAGIASLCAAAVFVLGRPDGGGFWLWSFTFFIELSVMSATALAFAMVLPSAAASALCTLGFYALARASGILLGIASLPPTGWVTAILNNTMQLISIIIPRLDMMGQTGWLVYGAPKGLSGIGFLPQAGTYAHALIAQTGLGGFAALQGVLFVALLAAVTCFDLARKQF